MKQFVLNKKTGFVNLTPDIPIVINDFRGIIFYDTTRLLKKVDKFNLPKGKYYLQSGNVKPVLFPVKHKLKPLPRFERFRTRREIIIKYGKNPNKATIFTYAKKQIILFDDSFKMAPLPVITYIYYHEIGHNYYKTEHKADAYATNVMLKKGFNPSQIGYASLDTLSSIQYNRKKETLKRIL